MAQESKRLGIKITFSHEEVPLGTAGPLALAKQTLVIRRKINFGSLQWGSECITSCKLIGLHERK